MVSIIKTLDNFNTYVNQYEVLQDCLKLIQDPRTGQWFLMSSGMYPILLMIVYFYIVKVLGPRLMKDRKPFNIKRIMIVYNFLQVIFNGWMCYEFSCAGWLTRDWSYTCQPMDYSNSPKAIRMARVCWWFYISKYIDILDTIFFILRKKDNQMTALHLIHHGTVPFSVWIGVKFAPGGHATSFGFLNTFVHCVMYSYYCLAALGPDVQKYLWWKKYITTIQMVQFIIVLVHCSQIFVSNCDYPRLPTGFLLVNIVLFLVLFSQFYEESYNKTKNNKNKIR